MKSFFRSAGAFSDDIIAKTGGRMSLKIPVRIVTHEETVLSGSPEAHTQAPPDLPARRLLVLDDDADVRRTVALMGTRLGAEVQACSTLAEFEAVLWTFVPDILLIDLMMPDVDGIDVVTRLGPICDAAIYVMTGADKRTFEASREVLRKSEVAVAGFLHKPFSAAELRGALEGATGTIARDAQPVAAKPKFTLLSAAELEKSARRGDVGPFFQPIFDAPTRRLKGFEALLRIEGQSSAYFASEYLDHLVKDDVLSTFITDVVIERSLRFLASLAAAPDLTMSINIFGIHAVTDGFRERLIESCALHGIAPRRIMLELSEAAVCELGEKELRKITQLRLAGFGLSIDDFGTGNSSLGRLASLPFSELKIDKSFCLALPESESAEAVVEACLGLARKLDMKVTAEGVETGEVAAILTRMGCDALQGHFFGRAMPGSDVIDWMGRGCPLPAA
jgi:EAL domain-containing protein (putative c-di-GMP-specific phosphodiesterase class I)/FixJ family two-component response regulator